MPEDTRPRLRCSVQFLRLVEGGRTSPLPSLAGGVYRPHLLTSLASVPAETDYLGVAFVSGPDRFEAGQIHLAEFICLYPSGVDYSSLTPGASFRVVEGKHLVATGHMLP